MARVATVRVREGQDWKLYRDAATLVMVRVAAAVVRQDWKLHRRCHMCTLVMVGLAAALDWKQTSPHSSPH